MDTINCTFRRQGTKHGAPVLPGVTGTTVVYRGETIVVCVDCYRDGFLESRKYDMLMEHQAGGHSRSDTVCLSCYMSGTGLTWAEMAARCARAHLAECESSAEAFTG